MTRRERRDAWRSYLAAKKGPFLAVELFERPSWIERAWLGLMARVRELTP